MIKISGETETQVSAWTTDSLKEFFEKTLFDLEKYLQRLIVEHDNNHGHQREAIKEFILKIIENNDLRYQQRFESQESNLVTAIIAQEKAITAALSAAERAVMKAEAATEKRFEGVNEFRGQLADQARDLMPRLEAEQAIKTLSEKYDSLSNRFNKTESHGEGLQDGWKYLLGAIGVLAVVIPVIILIIQNSAK